MSEQSLNNDNQTKHLPTAPFGEDIETKELGDRELAPVNADPRVLAERLRGSLIEPDIPHGPDQSAQGQ